jgi:hypothetical protein
MRTGNFVAQSREEEKPGAGLNENRVGRDISGTRRSERGAKWRKTFFRHCGDRHGFCRRLFFSSQRDSIQMKNRERV